jgi:hypothetical protein
VLCQSLSSQNVSAAFCAFSHCAGAEGPVWCLLRPSARSACLRRQLLALTDVLDLLMAEHPRWLQPGLRVPPPTQLPSGRIADVLRGAVHIITAPARWGSGNMDVYLASVIKKFYSRLATLPCPQLIGRVQGDKG